MKRILEFCTVVALSLVTSGVLLAQGNSDVGTWKLNVTKSKWVNASPAKSETRTVVPEGAGAKVTIEGIAADGSRIAYSYTTNYDGKESSISGVGAVNGEDTNAVKRVDANTFTATGKKAGKVVQTARFVVSKDGKVMTITAKGTNAQGQSVSATTIWEKQ